MVYPPLIGLLQWCKVATHFVGSFRAMCIGWLKIVDHTLHPTLYKSCALITAKCSAWKYHYSFEVKIRVDTRSYFSRRVN